MRRRREELREKNPKMMMIMKMAAATTTLMNMTHWRQKTQTTMMTTVGVTLFAPGSSSTLLISFDSLIQELILCAPQIKMMKTQMAETEETTGEMSASPKRGHLKIKWVNNISFSNTKRF